MTTCAIAQGGLTGSVVDSTSGNGLAKATVMLLRGGKTIKFVRTDDKGRFSFDVAAQQGDELQAILMGYGKHCQAVGKDNTIRLSQKTFQLKEVKVRVLRSPKGRTRLYMTLLNLPPIVTIA